MILETLRVSFLSEIEEDIRRTEGEESVQAV
jgi:hypothetical protein